MKENQLQQAPKAKNKTTSVIWAVISGPGTWAYTYKKDQLKFWICMAWYVLFTIAIAVVLGELYAELGMAAEGADFESVVTKIKWLSVSIPINMGVWVWAIIDAVRKPAAWYQQYPNYSE